MKWLCIALLVANVSYLGWEYNRQLGEEWARRARDLPVAAGAERLELLSELERPPEPRPSIEPAQASPAALPAGPKDGSAGAPTSEADSPPLPADKEPAASQSMTEAAPPGQPRNGDVASPEAGSSPRTDQATVERTAKTNVCLSVGPFVTESDAAHVRNWFGQHHAQARQRAEEKIESKRFWVYLQPQGSAEAVGQLIEEMKTKGVEDFLPVKDGDMKNAISLGVYSSQASTDRRLSELAAQGYHASVMARHKAKTVYWIDARAEDGALAEAKRQFPGKVANVRMACGEIARRSGSP